MAPVLLGDGVDEETWEHHLKNGDYARWFRTAIKDEDLASLAEKLQRENGVASEESLKAIRSAIEQKYTMEG